MEEAKAVRRLTVFGDLAESDLQLLAERSAPPINFKAKSVMQRQGTPTPPLLLVHSGWCMSSMTMLDGKRQITKLHLPGDLVGTPNLPVGYAVETVTALTGTVASTFSSANLGALFERSPRIAAMLFLISQEERLVLMDRLAMIGRLSGASRIAALILHLFDRLKVIGLEHNGSITIPLTQDIIADILGLTSVHVNRLLRRLKDSGLITYSYHNYHITDIEGLQQVATLPRRKAAGPISWLPETN